MPDDLLKMTPDGFVPAGEVDPKEVLVVGELVSLMPVAYVESKRYTCHDCGEDIWLAANDQAMVRLLEAGATAICLRCAVVHHKMPDELITTREQITASELAAMPRDERPN